MSNSIINLYYIAWVDLEYFHNHKVPFIEDASNLQDHEIVLNNDIYVKNIRIN